MDEMKDKPLNGGDSEQMAPVQTLAVSQCTNSEVSTQPSRYQSKEQLDEQEESNSAPEICGSQISIICSTNKNSNETTGISSYNIDHTYYDWPTPPRVYNPLEDFPAAGYYRLAPAVPFQERPDYWSSQYCNPNTATSAEWFGQPAPPTKPIPTETGYSENFSESVPSGPSPSASKLALPAVKSHNCEHRVVASSSSSKRRYDHDRTDYYSSGPRSRSRSRESAYSRRLRRSNERSRSRSRELQRRHIEIQRPSRYATRSRGSRTNYAVDRSNNSNSIASSRLKSNEPYRQMDSRSHDRRERSKEWSRPESDYERFRSNNSNFIVSSHLKSNEPYRPMSSRSRDRRERSKERPESDYERARRSSFSMTARPHYSSRHYYSGDHRHIDNKRHSADYHSSLSSSRHRNDSDFHHSSRDNHYHSRHHENSSRNRSGCQDHSLSSSLRNETRRSSFKADIDSDLTHDDTTKDGDEIQDESDESIEKWVRSAPEELYYSRDQNEMKATDRTKHLCEKFEVNLLQKAKTAREEAERLGTEKMKELIAKEEEELGEDNSTSESDDSSSEEENSSKPGRSTAANRELERRKLHPRRLHSELWHNDPGLMNDGPVCRCSAKARRFGIRHGFYPGEDIVYKCEPFSNNRNQLYHYRITITPAKNFLVNSPTVINHDGHDYLFEGFSLLSHYELDLKLPPCKVIRFNIRYDVFLESEPHPESFCVKELNLFETYIFREILELVDWKLDWDQSDGCSQFHLMPRFVRQLPDNGREILSMNRILLHLLKNDKDLVKEDDHVKLLQVEQKDWQNFADKHKGMIVTKWGMKPCALRVDQIDRDITFEEDSSTNQEEGIPYPLIVHFGIRPPQLSYAGNSGYQRAWRRYVKYRHLLSNMPKPSIEEKRKLVAKDLKLRQIRTASTMKRDVTVDISAKGFRTTGICCDIIQHAMLIPVLVGHLRFHRSLLTLEKRLQYTFQNPYLLQLAMTHPSYRENFGTNPDHARNALTNCSIRQPEYGDRRIHYSSTRKRGINTLINIMARFGAEDETESEITHNERLEFLGDAVVEFATSIHLFHLFPDLEEGGLATYRAAIVQNQHLAELAQNLQLDQFMLYAHGSDLCHDSELRHAMANCFEALMGAIFLDGGIEVADRIFGRTLFETDAELYDIWTNYPKHPLQVQEPKGDRHWIKSHGGVLQKLTEFEKIIGLEFTHIRLLARAFTDRSLGYNNLSRGSNQRLEFLGDTVLQLISSEYLYRHFPDHHEGHLSLLRSSLVNNRTQSLVCDDLGMTSYAMRGDPKVELKTKDRADLLEAFLGALYIDKGLKYCMTFCSVCFIPRLSTSILKQEWNDPKSKLQQCCLTLRTMDGNEPDIPQYKITESKGPTNTRVYVVAVFFRGERLATAEGHSIQEAEMNAAACALKESEDLFPQLSHQRRVIDKTNKRYY